MLYCGMEGISLPINHILAKHYFSRIGKTSRVEYDRINSELFNLSSCKVFSLKTQSIIQANDFSPKLKDAKELERY